MPARELTIGFDADDTLWHNETVFAAMHARFGKLLAHHHDAATVERELLATELRNLECYGYGVKSFTLSAIETAIHLSSGQISAAEIQHLIDLGRGMLAHPVELLDGVAETLAGLTPAGAHRLLVITKGDLRDQQSKLARSGLADHFDEVEIVAEKDPRRLRRHPAPARHRAGEFPDGRQLHEERHPAGARIGRRGGAYPLPFDVAA